MKHIFNLYFSLHILISEQEILQKRSHSLFHVCSVRNIYGKLFSKVGFFLNLTIKECAKIRVWCVIADLVGLVQQCHCAFVVISWVLNFSLWVFRGSNFFWCVLHWSKTFLVGFCVGPKVFLVGIWWVQFSFSALISLDSKIFSCYDYMRKSDRKEKYINKLKLRILFQIYFNSFQLYLYQKSTSSTKLVMLLRLRSFHLFFQSFLFFSVRISSLVTVTDSYYKNTCPIASCIFQIS